MAIRVEDMVFDGEQLIQGKGALLVDVAPFYKYKDGEKTDIIEGYRYTVALVAHKLEKVGVKVEGSQLLDFEDVGMKQVEFDGLEAKFYKDFKNNTYKITASATNIRLAE